MPHSRGTSLGAEIDTFSAAWRVYQTGKRGVIRRKNSLGNHVAREVTYGESGWHYHFHQLRYDEAGSYCETRARADWLTALQFVGRRSRGAEDHAFDVGVVGDQAGARYVAKLSTAVEAQARAIGSEIASSATKGKNLATLLKAAAAGDAVAAQTWISGVSEITARKVSSVRWSPGLAAELGIDRDKKTDEQVALDEVVASDIFLGALTPIQWRGILHYKAEFSLLVYANRGYESVNEFLSGLDLGKLNDDAPVAIETLIEGEQNTAPVKGPYSPC